MHDLNSRYNFTYFPSQVLPSGFNILLISSCAFLVSCLMFCLYPAVRRLAGISHDVQHHQQTFWRPVLIPINAQMYSLFFIEDESLFRYHL